jgi:hypothetical protein
VSVGESLGYFVAPRLGLAVGALVAMAAGWGLRFRPSLDAVAWRRGAVGESGALPGSLAGWSSTSGPSCMTWPSPAARPILITWPSAPVGCS